ncbi:MAG TPA: S41 family peptidase, partial [Candidatus Pacearchaeota archaeon]|nr:S41 family peptidase [Candidatus Pacearchaeota archaeon]
MGLKPGDKILKVGATSTDGIDLDQVVKMIRGKKGTQVKLTIARGEVNASNIREFVITRDVINVPSVELDFVKSPDGEEIAHLTVSQYTMNTHRDFQKAMREVDQKKIKRLIIDLRNNPGGLLDQATALSEYFLKKGDVIVIEGGGKVSEEKIYTAFEDGKYREMPLVVLINKGSASGAEIMAAALHDNGRAKLIGETTFGKGSVQMPLKLRDGAMLKMTIAQWMTPKKEIIDQKGIVPDIEIKLSENGTSSAAQ